MESLAAQRAHIAADTPAVPCCLEFAFSDQNVKKWGMKSVQEKYVAMKADCELVLT